jgi:hypothetical protein
LILRAFSEGLAKQGYVPRKAAFLYKGIRPERLHEVVFVQNTSLVLCQHQQGVQNLGGKRNLFVFAEEQPLTYIESEGPKRQYGVMNCTRHDAQPKPIKKKSIIAQ